MAAWRPTKEGGRSLRHLHEDQSPRYGHRSVPTRRSRFSSGAPRAENTRAFRASPFLQCRFAAVPGSLSAPWAHGRPTPPGRRTTNRMFGATVLVKWLRQPCYSLASKVEAFNAGVAALAAVPLQFHRGYRRRRLVRRRLLPTPPAGVQRRPQTRAHRGVIVEATHKGPATLLALIRRRRDAGRAGAVQLFGRQCFEDSGGFALRPRPRGVGRGITARARGWTLRTLFKLSAPPPRPGGRPTRVLSRPASTSA